MLREYNNYNLPHYLELLSSQTSNDYSLWKLLKTMKRPKQQILLLKLETDGQRETVGEEVESVAEYF